MTGEDFCPIFVDEAGVVQLNGHALVREVAEQDRLFPAPPPGSYRFQTGSMGAGTPPTGCL